MAFLGTILFLLLIISLVGTIVGLIKPALFKQTNRWKVSVLGLILFVIVFVLLMVVAELDQEPSQQQTAVVVKPKEIYLNITHQEDAKGLLTFAVKTNLPDKSKIVLILYAAAGGQVGSAHVIIKNGVGNSPKFTDKGKPHQAGQYELKIWDFNRKSMQFEPIQYNFTKKISFNEKQVGNLANDKRFVNIFLESLEAEYDFFLQTVTQIDQDAQDLQNMSEANRQIQTKRLYDDWGNFSASYNGIYKILLPDNPGAPKELGAEWKIRKCKPAIDSVYFQPKLMFSAWSRINDMMNQRETSIAPFNQAHQEVLQGFKEIKEQLKLCK